MIEDILNEIKVMDKLCHGEHENIVEVYGHGLLSPNQTFYYIDMEVCDLNLKEYLKSEKRNIRGLLDWPKAINDGQVPFIFCAIIQQIIRGLIFIHDHGEAHRDLNPRND